jgi:hypothetical protein
VNSGLTPLFFSLFSSFFYSQASKATPHATTAALHVPEPVASMHPKNNPKMNPPSRSPVSPTVTNALKEENKGSDDPCETFKMAMKEEKVLGIVSIKDDDDKRCLEISSTENDATTKFENDATGEGYEHIGEGAVL